MLIIIFILFLFLPVSLEAAGSTYVKKKNIIYKDGGECIECKAKNRSNAKYCVSCGSRLRNKSYNTRLYKRISYVKCTLCNKEFNNKYKFCPIDGGEILFEEKLFEMPEKNDAMYWGLSLSGLKFDSIKNDIYIDDLLLPYGDKDFSESGLGLALFFTNCWNWILPDKLRGIGFYLKSNTIESDISGLDIMNELVDYTVERGNLVIGTTFQIARETNFYLGWSINSTTLTDNLAENEDDNESFYDRSGTDIGFYFVVPPKPNTMDLSFTLDLGYNHDPKFPTLSIGLGVALATRTDWSAYFREVDAKTVFPYLD